MEAQPTPRARRSPLARYAPALAVIVVVAIVAAVIGILGGGSKKVTTKTNPNGSSALPVLYSDAKQQGKLSQYTWQPHCDTTTGDVAIPILYPPPCVPAPGGSNGGSTSPGVTATAIKVGYYLPKPDPIYDPILRAAGAYDKPSDTAKAYKDYVQIYAHLYETYGRSIDLVPIHATGGATDEVAARADADQAAAKGVFAVVGGPAQTRSFQAELARRKILCVGVCVIASPAATLQQYSPYLWTVAPTPEETSQLTTELIKKQLIGKPAIYAGEPQLKSQTRKFALLSYDTPDGEYAASWNTFYNELKQAGAPVAGHVSYFLNPQSLAADTRTVATKLKATGATTIVFTGDPIFPALLTAQMTQQGYFPEWVMAGTVLADTNVFARKFDQQQWSHTFGLQLIPAKLPKPQQDSYSLHEWWFGTPPPTQNNFAILKGDVELLMNGIQLAGPTLTPQTFRDGMYHLPPNPQGPRSLRQVYSWGNHGIWQGTDVGTLDNAGILFWDPKVVGADETGAVGPGMYRLVDGGKRYLPGQWPTTPVKLFDPAGTVTIYPADKIPPELLPKSEPVPAGAPTHP